MTCWDMHRYVNTYMCLYMIYNFLISQFALILICDFRNYKNFISQLFPSMLVYLFCLSATLIIREFIKSVQISSHFSEMHRTWHFIVAHFVLAGIRLTIIPGSFKHFYLRLQVSLGCIFLVCHIIPKNMYVLICVQMYIRLGMRCKNRRATLTSWIRII